MKNLVLVISQKLAYVIQVIVYYQQIWPFSTIGSYFWVINELTTVLEQICTVIYWQYSCDRQLIDGYKFCQFGLMIFKFVEIKVFPDSWRY